MLSGLNLSFWKISSQFSPFHDALRVYRMFGLIEDKGWKCTTSAELETKILAVSPVMDNYEQLDKDGQKNLNTIFKK